MKHFIDYREVARHVVQFLAAEKQSPDESFKQQLARLFDVAEAIEAEAVRRQCLQLEKETLAYKSKPGVTTNG